MVMGNVTVHDFTTLAMVLIILLVRGQAEVAAIRFSPTSPPALANPRESEALSAIQTLGIVSFLPAPP